jgi:hypothetical protein
MTTIMSVIMIMAPEIQSKSITLKIPLAVSQYASTKHVYRNYVYAKTRPYMIRQYILSSPSAPYTQ